MRIKIYILCSFILLRSAIIAQSKNELLSMSIAGGGVNYFTLGTTPLISLRAQKKVNDNGDAIYFQFNYELPYQLAYKTEAVAIENGTKPSLIFVPYSVDYNYYNGTINYLYNLTDEDDEDYTNNNFYYYLFGGLGASLIKNNYAINNFDDSKYKIFYADLIKSQNFIGVNIDLGIGVNYTKNRFKIFSEGRISYIQPFALKTFETNNNAMLNASLLVGIGYVIKM
jgi:hypothetical protein